MRVLYFGASWCLQTRQLGEVFSKMTDLPAEVIAIDVDDASEVAIRYGIRGVPTMVVVDDEGKEVRRKVGMMSEAELRVLIS